jgi:hypothetical protein
MLNLEDDQFLNEIFSEIAVEIAEPSYVLSGSGIGWFLDPISKEMVRISRGVELIPVSSDLDEYDRILVKTPTRFLLIPTTEVEEIGWN